MQHLEASFFSANRRALLEATKAKLIVIAANAMVQRNADEPFKFRQESNFYYLTGIDQPEFVLVLSPDDEFVIIGPRDPHRDDWDGPVDLRGLKKVSGISKFYDQAEGWERLAVLAKKAKTIHANPPKAAYLDMFNFFVNPAVASLEQRLKDAGAKKVISCRLDIARLRHVKKAPEIAMLTEAVNITVATLKDIHANLATYHSENELDGAVSAGFRSRGATGPAYESVVASGVNAATIHHRMGSTPLTKKDLLLFDIGAEVGNYCADITRTWAVGKPSQRQRDIHDAILAAYAFAFEALKPGVVVRDYEKAVDDFMGEQMVKLGLIADVTEKEKLRKYYPHLVSHFLGLDVHDAGDYDQVVQPGMVMTIEPGLYIPAEKIGIRVEDDILVTDHGNRVLGDPLPLTLEY